MDNFREKKVFKKEWESMSLDEYYEKSVKKTTNFKAPRSKPNSQFRRTHYFASNYRQKPLTEASLLHLRLDILCSQLVDLKLVVDSKGLVDFAQKRLEQIKKRLAQLPPMPPKKSAPPKGAPPKGAPPKAAPPKAAPPKASLSKAAPPKAAPPKASHPEQETQIESKEDSPVAIPPGSPGTPDTLEIDDTLVLTIDKMDTLWMPADVGSPNES